MFSSVQFSSVSQSCPTLCDPMNCSTPGLPVHHQLPEFTQTHIHWVSDAIQPSHPLSSPSPPAPIPPSITVFSNESTLHMRWRKYWSFSFSIIPSKSYFYLLVIWLLSVYSFFIYLLLWTFCSYPLPIFFFWDSDLFTLMIYRCSLYIKGIDTLLCLLQISFLYIISHLIFYVVFVIERLKQTIEKPWPYLITFSFVVLYFMFYLHF